MGRITVRLDFGDGGAIGPGKIRLLELIGVHGSITAAGRAMGMSYRRAWLLVDALNQAFRLPVVATQIGGASGGGAVLTDAGRAVVAHYRAIEAAAAAASSDRLDALAAMLADRPAGGGKPG